MASVTIVGAGPAGAAVAYLLARNGISVTLLERRRDFAREFRGEVLMPGGLDALNQMGLQDVVEALSGVSQQQFAGYLNGGRVVDFPIPAEQSVRAISQPALLEMLVGQAERFPSFRFIRGASVKALIRSDAIDGAVGGGREGRVTGVRVRADGVDQDIFADVCIGADGRHSMVRRALGLTTAEQGVPMDIVWCQLPLPQGWRGARAYAGGGHLLLAYEKWDGDLQLGWVILKGRFGDLRAKGTAAWVQDMADQVSPDLATHLLANAESIKKPFLLDVASDCVESWSADGALVIGDAAHTMSPVGAQGINVALRDALVTANHLVTVLLQDAAAEAASGPVPQLSAIDAELQAIEAERMPEIRELQRLQALPPRVVLKHGWWGDRLRRVLAGLLSSSAVQGIAARRATAFLNGVTDVKLKV